MSSSMDTHYTVTGIIERDGKYLIIERSKPPLGFSIPGGHKEENETLEQAIHRELMEEVSIRAKTIHLAFEREMDSGGCPRHPTHHHYAYLVTTEDEPSLKAEVASIQWLTPDEIRPLSMTEYSRTLFTELNII